MIFFFLLLLLDECNYNKTGWTCFSFLNAVFNVNGADIKRWQPLKVGSQSSILGDYRVSDTVGRRALASAWLQWS